MLKEFLYVIVLESRKNLESKKSLPNFSTNTVIFVRRRFLQYRIFKQIQIHPEQPPCISAYAARFHGLCPSTGHSPEFPHKNSGPGPVRYDAGLQDYGLVEENGCPNTSCTKQEKYERAKQEIIC